MVNRELNDEFVRVIAKQLGVEVEEWTERSETTDMYGLSDGRWIEVVDIYRTTYFMLKNDDPDNLAETPCTIVLEYRNDVL
jgi:hypothetical protein